MSRGGAARPTTRSANLWRGSWMSLTLRGATPSARGRCSPLDVVAPGKDPCVDLVSHGTDDPLITARSGRELARRIPGARFEPIEGAGRVLILERTEEVTGLVMEFISRHDELVV
jgi:pimeloyl-ACP methyl ester carboxylesterase